MNYHKVDVVMNAVSTLDEAYGVDGDVDGGDGGFVVVIEAEDELEKLKEFHLDVKTAMPEYVDKIQCRGGRYLIMYNEQ